jgi:cell division transport system permease protein
MQISHIFSELGTGLKRNVSMTVSLVVTTFVSLTLVGFGLLVNSQANQTEEYFGDRLTVQVILCSDASTTGTCLDGAANENQRADIEAALDENPEVKSFDFQTSREAYDKAKELYTQNPSGERAFEFTTPDRFPRLVLRRAQRPEAVHGRREPDDRHERRRRGAEPLGLPQAAVSGAGLHAVGCARRRGLLVLAAVLQVSNTIRLTAYARRREIGIMRLVGASSWHIQLPFILESLIASLFAGLLACGALIAFWWFGIRNGILEVDGLALITTWVGVDETLWAGGLTLGLAVLLGLVPPLLLTRKYLDV